MNRSSSGELFLRNNLFWLPILAAVPSAAVATTLRPAVVMSAGGSAVLIGSYAVLMLVRRHVVREALVPLIVIAGIFIAGIFGLVVQALDPELYHRLGYYLPLTGVCCWIMAPAFVDNSEWKTAYPFRRIVFNALRYAAMLTLTGLIREGLGRGTVLDFPLFGASFREAPVLLLQQPAGGLMVLGIIAGVLVLFSPRKKHEKLFIDDNRQRRDQ